MKRLAAITVGLCLVATSAHAISSAINISTRMVVETGDNVLIGGFIVYGTGQKTVAIRAIGPSLPLPGTLSDPVLELYDATGTLDCDKRRLEGDSTRAKSSLPGWRLGTIVTPH